MVELSEGIPFLIATALSYLLFVFVGERFSPFTSPRRHSPGLRKWHLARILSAIFLFTCYLVLIYSYFLTWPGAQIVVAVVGGFVGLGAIPIFLYMRNFNKKEKYPPIVTQSYPVRATIQSGKTISTLSDSRISGFEEKRISDIERKSESVGTSTVASRMDETRQTEFEAAELSISEEHELELQLATDHINPSLSDFDQSIAEAEFRDTYSDELEFGDVAKPDSGKDGWNIQSDSEGLEPSMSEDFDTEEFLELFKETNSDYSDRDISAKHAALLNNVKTQGAEIHELKRNNEELIQKREQLVSDIEMLNFEVRKSKAISRKYAMEKIRAVRVKNKALELATMERKKRKMVEVRAQKIIRRLRKDAMRPAELSN